MAGGMFGGQLYRFLVLEYSKVPKVLLSWFTHCEGLWVMPQPSCITFFIFVFYL